MIRVLYRASQAGVSMDLLVRGICSLRPGIPGVSDNIRVRSIVGRFLEHSRIYWFQNGGHEEMYIGSADLMERNLDRRVETLTPVRDPEILEHLRDVVLDAYLRDTDRAMVLDSSGRYARPEPASGRFNAQQFLLKHYTDTQPTRISSDRSDRSDGVRIVQESHHQPTPAAITTARHQRETRSATRASRIVIVTAKAIGPSGQRIASAILVGRLCIDHQQTPHDSCDIDRKPRSQIPTRNTFTRASYLLH